jgi:UrcA family protein
MVEQHRCSSATAFRVYREIKPAPAPTQTQDHQEAVMRSLLILAAASAALTSVPASSQQVPSNIVIHYADLDLATQAGAATLDRRISAAVRWACGPTSDVDPAGKNRARSCRKAIASQVRAQRERAVAATTRTTVLASKR